jgi:hypothetical protein
MKTKTKSISFSMPYVITILIALMIMAFITMVAWNWLMPEIFGLIKITYWQALGLNVLTDTLFKNRFPKKKITKNITFDFRRKM